ncbi:restriction endonuclease subunit S [Solemya velum gill symbiont]|nr:restriction endonuclease subunit S [Solemya velum gill symbiont]OOY58429.1 restriction endonuclease subunit S [Solemya velum gill symbiont]OOY70942.1 restriction endonuclease subunit S [Solemya velum gill symbiont]OOY84119.1 restriction endonuclease subunit S [Solemya velum gill symbiont]OOY95296.1 restriction endonuclease subunit S [Solemya velum gill symbiont]
MRKEGVFVIRSSNVKNGQIVQADNVYVNPEVVNCSNVKKGDIIVVVRNGSRALIGKHAQVNSLMDNTVIGAFMTGVRASYPEFINALFDTDKFKAQVEKNLGATINQITNGAFNSMVFMFPEGQDKTAIGNTFQKLDNLINQHQQKHYKLSNIKKAMLEKMFPKQGETIPEIRFKGFSGKWEEVTLGVFARFTKGQGYSKSDLSESGTPIILYGRLYTNYQTVISQVDTFTIEKSKSLKSIGNEVIVPASGESSEDIARASAVCEPGVILGGDLNIIYPNDKINPVFLALVISNGYPQKELASKAQGKSVVHIRNSDLYSLLFTMPNREEQTVIGNYFQKLDALINQHQQQITKLTNIKQACLGKMFV